MKNQRRNGSQVYNSQLLLGAYERLDKMNTFDYDNLEQLFESRHQRVVELEEQIKGLKAALNAGNVDFVTEGFGLEM